MSSRFDVSFLPLLSRCRTVDLPKEEELRLARLSAKGDIQARNTLIEANLRLAVVRSRMMAVKFRKTSVDDLLGPALLGLCGAATAYDPDRGVRFSSFAYMEIGHSIYRYLKKQRRFDVEVPNTYVSDEGDEVENEGAGPPTQQYRAFITIIESSVSGEDKLLLTALKESDDLTDLTEQLGITKQAVSLRKIKLCKQLRGKLGHYGITGLGDLA